VSIFYHLSAFAYHSLPSKSVSSLSFPIDGGFLINLQLCPGDLLLAKLNPPVPISSMTGKYIMRVLDRKRLGDMEVSDMQMRTVEERKGDGEVWLEDLLASKDTILIFLKLI
jgi:hypothetical protein